MTREPKAETWDHYWAHVSAETGYRNFHQDMLDNLYAVTDIKGKRVLDIGGAGAISADLVAAGAHVTLIDFSTVAVGLAQNFAKGTAFEIAQADANQLPFGCDSFDIVLHQGFLEHFADPLPLLLEQQRILKPHGLLLVDVPQRFNVYALQKRLLMQVNRWPYGWETDFSYAALRRVVAAAGFVEVAAYGRSYYPRPLYLIRHLQKLEERVGIKLGSRRFWHEYDASWSFFEHSWMGLHTLMNIGLIAKKPHPGRG